MKLRRTGSISKCRRSETANIKSKFISQQQNYILHKQTARKVLLRGGHMAYFVPSSCNPKHKLGNDIIYTYIIYVSTFTHLHDNGLGEFKKCVKMCENTKSVSF